MRSIEDDTQRQVVDRTGRILHHQCWSAHWPLHNVFSLQQSYASFEELSRRSTDQCASSANNIDAHWLNHNTFLLHQCSRASKNWACAQFDVSPRLIILRITYPKQHCYIIHIESWSLSRTLCKTFFSYVATIWSHYGTIQNTQVICAFPFVYRYTN